MCDVASIFLVATDENFPPYYPTRDLQTLVVSAAKHSYTVSHAAEQLISKYFWALQMVSLYVYMTFHCNDLR